jgi:hypothetical protein
VRKDIGKLRELASAGAPKDVVLSDTAEDGREQTIEWRVEIALPMNARDAQLHGLARKHRPVHPPAQSREIFPSLAIEQARPASAQD